jgi:hypothetical protein
MTERAKMKVTPAAVPHAASPWFFGPYGFVIAETRPRRFLPCKGALGFFRPTINLSDLQPA